jgi:hypothetical protein
MAASQGATVLYMYDDLDAVKSRWSDDEMYDFSIMPKVSEWYEKAGQDSILPRIRCKMTELINGDGTHTQNLLNVLRFHDENNSKTKYFKTPGLGYGNPGGFMLIGDRPNNSIVPSGGVFAPWIYGDSSDYIWHAIESNSIAWSKGYYTNASSFTNPHEFNAYVEDAIKPEHIICIGGEASKLCNVVGLEHRMVNHPAYMKRFHAYSKDQYAELIRDIMTEYMPATTSEPESEPGEGNDGPTTNV